MLKKFVRKLMKTELNHWNTMNQCLNHKQVTLSKMLFEILFFFSLKDHGTSHCSIIDATGNAVAVTSTVNTE